MRQFKILEVTRSVEVKRICNGCGLVFDSERDEYEEWQFETIHLLKVHFGYSEKNDLTSWEFDLCEDCLEKIANTFKIPPTVKNTDVFGEPYPDEI